MREPQVAEALEHVALSGSADWVRFWVTEKERVVDAKRWFLFLEKEGLAKTASWGKHLIA